jgi:hypothetical protein
VARILLSFLLTIRQYARNLFLVPAWRAKWARPEPLFDRGGRLDPSHRRRAEHNGPAQGHTRRSRSPCHRRQRRPDRHGPHSLATSIDGLSLALALKHNPCAAGVPLIAMSGSDSALAIADGTGDFDAYVGKPFDYDAIVNTVERLLKVAF